MPRGKRAGTTKPVEKVEEVVENDILEEVLEVKEEPKKEPKVIIRELKMEDGTIKKERVPNPKKTFIEQKVLHVLGTNGVMTTRKIDVFRSAKGRYERRSYEK